MDQFAFFFLLILVESIALIDAFLFSQSTFLADLSKPFLKNSSLIHYTKDSFISLHSSMFPPTNSLVSWISVSVYAGSCEHLSYVDVAVLQLFAVNVLSLFLTVYSIIYYLKPKAWQLWFIPYRKHEHTLEVKI